MEVAFDEHGRELKPGVELVPWEIEDGGVRMHVVEVTEYDGDVDDEGRAIAVLPKVVVRWEDGDVDSFVCRNATPGPNGWDEPKWVCDEVEVLVAD